MASPIQKVRDIIAKGEKLNSPLYDAALVLEFRAAANPADLLPLLRLLVECEAFVEKVGDDCNSPWYKEADALLDKLRKDQ